MEQNANGRAYDVPSYRSQRTAQRIGEDLIDWMHRLARMGCKAPTIARICDLDRDDVIYWMERNGYREF